MADQKFILDDFSRVSLTGELKNKSLGKLNKPKGLWTGHCLVATPFEAHTAINFTGPIGAGSAVYYSLIFQLGKWEFWGIQKYDEWIEASPVHAGYYQLTHKQKEDLETKIKSGLASAAQAVADYELLLHDKRKYEEMLHYLGYETKTIDDIAQIDFSIDNEDKTRKQRESRVDNHSLKAMFIDQIDIHTGEGISMRSIVQRWPTLISDFMRLDDDDIDPDNVKTKLDVSRAEAVILVTKNKLYLEWKKLFLPEAKDRYQRIMDLVISRRKSLHEYKEWLKPYIARHKLIEEGLSDPGRRINRVISPLATSGHPSSGHEIVVWVWKDFMPPEFYKQPAEISAHDEVDVYDNWTRDNLIFNKKYGLIVKHPWITEDWVLQSRQKFFDDRWLIKHKHYYSFFEITFTRYVMRTPQGEELEDATFDINLALMSQNALFAKLLDMRAKQEEFNKYIDEMLGVPTRLGHAGAVPEAKEKKKNPVSRFLDKANLKLMFMKHRPYERDFDDRITKYYLAPVAGDRFVPIVNFIKTKIGYGT